MNESNSLGDEVKIFAEAKSLPTREERRDFLEKRCADNPELRCEIEELLAVYDRDFLENSPPGLGRSDSADDPVIEPPGTMIGRYKILELIGQGGMGEVYMAEQVEPVHRKVALKVIKSGMDSKLVVARFEAERQALALMNHANIAKFFDAGLTEPSTDLGSINAAHRRRPYFVMELVKGQPIIDFCEQHKLGLRAKLDLFSQVCQGVQHAHQKGVIHRDLKPSNVLVARYDDRPVAKIIDFGVAKAIGERLTDKTLFTRFGQLVGTLQYMSPEQAQLNQLDVDTRTDIYSLGAIFYELLTGTPPFEKERISSAALEEALRMLREDEPDKPSTRLSKLSSTRLTIESPKQLTGKPIDCAISADLDWIVMKCLEKDRARRYVTTDALFKDVGNYLNDLPVSAGPPTVSYRLAKYLRRNRLAVSFVALIGLALIFGTTISTWQAIRANIAERRASQTASQLATALTELSTEKEHADNQKVKAETEQRRSAKFLEYMLGTLNSPLSADSINTRVIDVLHNAAKNAESKFKEDPIVAARILQSIADTFTELDRGEEAIPYAERSQEIFENTLGPDHRETLNAFHYVYWAYHNSPKFSANRERLWEEAKSIYSTCQRILSEADPALIRNAIALSDAYAHNIKADNDPVHDQFMSDALVKAKTWKTDPDKHDDFTHVVQNVAKKSYYDGDYERALDLYNDVLEFLENQNPHAKVKSLVIKSSICRTHSAAGNHVQAESLSRQLLNDYIETFGEHDQLTIMRRAVHATILAESGKRLAQRVADESVQLAAQHYPNSPLYVKVLGEQVKVLVELGDKSLAADAAREYLEQTSRILDWEEVVRNAHFLVSQLQEHGMHDTAIVVVDPLLDKLEQNSPTRVHAVLKSKMANCYLHIGNGKRSIQLAEELAQYCESEFGPSDERTIDRINTLANWYLRFNRPSDALAAAEKAIDRIRTYRPQDRERLAPALEWAGTAYFHKGDFEQAIRYFEQLLDLTHQTLQERYGKPFDIRSTLEFVGENAQQAMEQFPVYLKPVGKLASSYANNGQRERAIEVGRYAFNLYQKLDGRGPVAVQLRDTIHSLGTCYYVEAFYSDDLEQAEKAVSTLEVVFPDDPSQIDDDWDFLYGATIASASILLARYEDAANVIESIRPLDSADSRARVVKKRYQERLGYCQLKLGLFDEAKTSLEEFLADERECERPHFVSLAKCELGVVYVELDDVERGDELLTAGIHELWRLRDDAPKRYVVEAVTQAIDYFSKIGQDEKAKTWQDKLKTFADSSAEKDASVD